MVQDTDSTNPLIQDEQINLMLTYFPPRDGKPAWSAAAGVCDAIIFQFAQSVQNSAGPVSSSDQQAYDHYVGLAQQLRVLAMTNGKGIVPGSMAGIPTGSPVLGGSGPTYLGGTLYQNPEGM